MKCFDTSRRSAKTAVFLLLAAGATLTSGCRSSAPKAQPSAEASATAPASNWRLDSSTFNRSADPCTDFYEHVCGGFAKQENIPAGRAYADWARDAAKEKNDKALQQLLTGKDEPGNAELGRLRTFYASCMNGHSESDRATLAHWLTRIDGIQDRAQLMDVLTDLHGHGIPAFFGYSGEPDRMTRTRHRGEIHQAPLALPLTVLRSSGPEAEHKQKAFAAHVARMLELSGIPETRARTLGNAVLDIERRLSRRALTFGERFDDKVSEHPMTPLELASRAPHIRWGAYLERVGHPPEQVLNVTSPAYLRTVDAVLARRPLAQLRAYLRWRFLHAVGSALPPELAEVHFEFVKTAGAERPPREEVCQLQTLKGLGIELSRQFSQRFIGAEGRERATSVTRNVQAQMAEAVKDVDWLSPEARAAAQEKLRNASLKVGYPDEWPATGDFRLAENSFLENLLAVGKFEQERAWKRTHTERRRDSWEMTVYPWAAPGMAAARLVIPNGFPDVLSNSIIITAAYLRPPLLDPEAPPEVRYGGFGSMIGHELVHSIEVHMYDATGAYKEVWTSADKAAHEAKRQCLVEQANAFRAFGSTHLDGKATIDENVADLSGLAHSFAAMKRELGETASARGADGYSAEQRFFIAYAQSYCSAQRPEYERANLERDRHAPPRFRVNGPVSNFPPFAKAFSCAEGTAMARPAANRCQVW